VRVRNLILRDHDVELSAWVPPIDVGRQFRLERHESAGLTESGIDVSRITRAALRVDRAIIELAVIARNRAVGWL
jgi:hypothetical protein